VPEVSAELSVTGSFFPYLSTVIAVKLSQGIAANTKANFYLHKSVPKKVTPRAQLRLSTRKLFSTHLRDGAVRPVEAGYNKEFFSTQLHDKRRHCAPS
jgi:hypothetical protein